MARQGQTERRAVRLPDEAPSGQWLRSIRLSGFAITALGLLIGAVVVLAPSLRILIQQRQQISQLQSQVAESKKSLTALEKQKARWSDPNYVEAQARERLNFVFPGEYSYLVINDVPAGSTANGQPISDKLQTTQVDWVKSMLSSVFTAGLTTEPTSTGPTSTIKAPTIGDK